MSKFYRRYGSYSGGSSNRASKSSTIYGRVADVILDSTHPEYLLYGGPSSIGAIKVTTVDSRMDSSSPENLQIAFPIDPTIRRIPEKEEVVTLVPGPSTESSNTKSNTPQLYYSQIVGIWNHPTHNKSPELGLNPDNRPTPTLPDIDNVNPLLPSPGDLLLEGRLGSSLRFGGSKNIITADDEDSFPFTILSNGQKDVGNGLEHIVEDINEDPSSIYLTSNHIVPLTQSRYSFDSLKNKPLNADKYKGSQVLINAGRLYFNSKEENIIFSSKKDFYATGLNIGFDAEESTAINAQKIYLGINSWNENEPIVKGAQLELLLKDLLEIISGIGTAMQNATALTSNGAIPTLNFESATVIKRINDIKSKLYTIKSKKVYTE